jgi:hypothetical protein
MAEQIPEAWVGQEVIVYFEPAQRQAGTLEDVSERGIVVRSTRDETEHVFWYPLTSVTQLLKGGPQGGYILILNPSSHNTATRMAQDEREGARRCQALRLAGQPTSRHSS